MKNESGRAYVYVLTLQYVKRHDKPKESLTNEENLTVLNVLSRFMQRALHITALIFYFNHKITLKQELQLLASFKGLTF